MFAVDPESRIAFVPIAVLFVPPLPFNDMKPIAVELSFAEVASPNIVLDAPLPLPILIPFAAMLFVKVLFPEILF